VRRRRSQPAGVLLLEAVVALAVLVGFGGIILATLSDARAHLDVARRRVLAQDLAASAAGELAAGLRQAEELNGPVRDSTRSGAGAAFDERGPAQSGWELAVETSPAMFDGLTLVSVTARESSAGAKGGVPGGVSFTLRRLVPARVGPNSGGGGR
jgi:hypothetical protein